MKPDRFEPSAPKTRVAQALRLNFGCPILPVFEKFVTKAFITKNRKLSDMPLTIGWQDSYLLPELGSTADRSTVIHRSQAQLDSRCRATVGTA